MRARLKKTENTMKNFGRWLQNLFFPPPDSTPIHQYFAARLATPCRRSMYRTLILHTCGSPVKNATLAEPNWASRSSERSNIPGRLVRRWLPGIMNTGGGTSREGLGFGIHWHIENPVDFIALDEERQVIPYVRVQNEDGSYTEYVDTGSGFDTANIDASQLERMDCMSCHTRTSHIRDQPDER